MAEGPSEASVERRSTSKGPDPLIGRVINDRFRVVSLIARGGMGKVYRAEQAPLGREVALKVLNPNYSGDGDPEFHKRFFLEASTCSKLTHPNTVTIFDYGRTDDDVYYIAMELLDGRTLHRMLRDEGSLPPARALHVARQVCRSLREAHNLGVIHRDLKPANIYMVRHGDETDFVKVLDFGLVKEIGEGEDLTQTGLFMGSPKYMSPEQIRGEKVDGRADIYALGVILYEMLTGKVPFDRPNSVNILMAHVHEAPPPLIAANPECEVSSSIEQIVMKALAKNPDERFANMDELLAALKHGAVSAGLPPTHSMAVDLSGEFGAVGTTGRGAPVAISGLSPSSGSYTPITVSAPLAGPLLAAPVRKKSRLGLIVGGIVAFVVLAGIGGGLLALSDGEEAPVVAEPTERPVVPPPDEPDEPVSPGVVTTMVVLHSTPPGATVSVGDREYGATPADIEWTGADAERGRQVTFVFRLEGYRDYSVTRVVTSDRLEVSATLEPIQAMPDPRPRRPSTRPRPHGSEGGAPIKGYKLDPY
jgi:hypothetical protein